MFQFFKCASSLPWNQSIPLKTTTAKAFTAEKKMVVDYLEQTRKEGRTKDEMKDGKLIGGVRERGKTECLIAFSFTADQSWKNAEKERERGEIEKMQKNGDLNHLIKVKMGKGSFGKIWNLVLNLVLLEGGGK